MAKHKRNHDDTVKAYVWYLRGKVDRLVEKYLGESKGFKAVHERFLRSRGKSRPGQGFKKFQDDGTSHN